MKTLCLFALLQAAALNPAAAQPWRLLALRVDFPAEDPDEPTTTGNGQFDLRPVEEALPTYRFPFDLPPHDRLYFESHLQALAHYYERVSEGRVKIEFEVFPQARGQVYTLSRSALYYGSGRSEAEIGQRWVELFREAVALAEADPQGPRFAEFNSFLIFHAGVGNETGALNDIRSVFLSAADLERYGGGPILVEGGTVAIREGWILPESPSLDGRAGLNGLLAKFFGYQLGLPGLSNFAEGLPALGGWSLMDVGGMNLGFVRQDSLMPVVGFAPPYPMAWERAFLGWTEPLVIQRDTTIALLAADRTGTLPKEVHVPLDPDEYLLLENRQQRGRRGAPAGTPIAAAGIDPEEVIWLDASQVEFSPGNRVWLSVAECDAFIPGSGVLVWHVDDSVIQEQFAAGAINNDPVYPGIALVEADGYRDIGNPTFERLGQSEGSPEDPFFAGGRDLLGPDTYPDTRTYQGWDSGVSLQVLSPPGDTMQVRIRFSRQMSGWPRECRGGRRLQAAEVDGDGRGELIAEQERGLSLFRADRGLVLEVEEGRFLAAAEVDGEPGDEIFVCRGRHLESWKAAARQPKWRQLLDFEPACGLVAELGLFPGHPLLALGGERVVLLDAREGTLQQEIEVRATSLLAADLDGDAAVELIGADPQGIWVLQAEGMAWLWEASGEAFLPPMAGDLDDDQIAEVVVAAPDGRVRIWRGNEMAFVASVGDSLRAPPALGDLDGDGRLELVLAGTDQVHALRFDGLQQADFPARLPRFAGVGAIAWPPLLLDLDQDGRQEILLGTAQGVFGVDDRGSLLPGFPLLTAAAISFAPVAADLDGDGSLELAALAGDWLYVWEPQNFSPPYAGQKGDWLQAGRTAQGTLAHPGAGPPAGPTPAGRLLRPGSAYCYPNPVPGSETAHLRFFLERPARLKIEVFGATGERVEVHEVGNGLAAPSEHEFAWPIARYASGLYFCRLEAQDERGDRETIWIRMAVSR